MCRLGGEFAGILRVHVPAERRPALESALLRCPTSPWWFAPMSPSCDSGSGVGVFGCHRAGPAGIVRKSAARSRRTGVNVEELATECTSAPMSGEPLFQAHAKLQLPRV